MVKARKGKSSHRKWLVWQKVRMEKRSHGKMFERKRFVFEKVRRDKAGASEAFFNQPSLLVSPLNPVEAAATCSQI